MSVNLHCGDCLTVLQSLDPLAADLAYLDPPFGMGQTMRGPTGHTFEDQLDTPEDYVAFITPRIEAVLRHLHTQAIILLHCDWRHVHHLRLLLDRLLGREAFVNHLVWRYGLGGSSSRRFARKHDDILFYARGSNYFFDPPLVPATSQRLRGQMKKATDVLDVPAINNMAHERTGWPTQKPLALMRLLVQACCPPEGLVLDPCCGSGTTLVAATESGRNAVGIDHSPEAINLVTTRLAKYPVVVNTAPIR